MKTIYKPCEGRCQSPLACRNWKQCWLFRCPFHGQINWWQPASSLRNLWTVCSVTVCQRTKNKVNKRQGNDSCYCKWISPLAKKPKQNKCLSKMRVVIRLLLLVFTNRPASFLDKDLTFCNILFDKMLSSQYKGHHDMISPFLLFHSPVDRYCWKILFNQ